MEYNFGEIELKWRQEWEKRESYKTPGPGTEGGKKPKYYVLDMFPYPSGAGLHVGHPLGYIATDIFARFKRLKGFNVLHPMGYDAFGLPAEQYAIETGQHPAVTTKKNIERYREQLDKIGFSFDWSREVRTSDPAFYKWTQWIFLKLFKSWYNNDTCRAEPIEKLISTFEKSGTSGINAACGEENNFSAAEWASFSEQEKSDILLNYRMAYSSHAWVNWCPKLGTVLANDEVKDGVSERGGYPVERKMMPQWSLRITAYADRLVNDLDPLDWHENIKEAQRNWIGRSEGCTIRFNIEEPVKGNIVVFTTRPDTIFGVTFITIAPESQLTGEITAPERKQKVEQYINSIKNKSDRERQAEGKNMSGEFTGAYALHPFTGKPVPIWIGDYVLPGYGTGAVMGVPAHDARDHTFALKFGLPVTQVIEAPPSWNFAKESYDAKEGRCVNSDFLNGLDVKKAINRAMDEIEKRGFGKRKINYRLRDAAFGRQRYWGEPIPIYYDKGIPKGINEDELPLILPEIDNFKPTETGEPPLARAKNWKYRGKYEYEHTTMPGWAGSSWYYLRYMDPHNDKEFASKEAINYWQNIDLYIGGAEHVTGHLLYVRFWTKFLYDLGYLPFTEPVKKLVNQGMILGLSEKIYLNKIISNTLCFFDIETGHIGTPIPISNDQTFQIFLSSDIYDRFFKNNPDYQDRGQFLQYTSINVPISLVKDNVLNINEFITERQEYRNAVFTVNGGALINCEINNEVNPQIIPSAGHNYFIECIGSSQIGFKTFNEIEKMSKSKHNVVNPDRVVEQYGADTLRMYEMFLGPIELSKPWSTQGISGVHNFLKKLWRMMTVTALSDAEPTPAELKILHKTIKKVNDDIERLSFNTSVSAFMICLNELSDLKCNKKAVYEPLLICLSPFAPFITEELWNRLGHATSILDERFPDYNEKYLEESSFAYPVSFNGKTRLMLELPLHLTKEQVEKETLQNEKVQKWLEGKPVKKVIVVPNKIVNIVI